MGREDIRGLNGNGTDIMKIIYEKTEYAKEYTLCFYHGENFSILSKN